MTTLRKGSRGEEVKKLQQLLGLKADGIFGVQTETAVKQFQLKHGLVADGIVGKNTWNKLLNMNKLEIENYFLKPGQYLEGNYKNEYIVLHHTASYDSNYQVVSNWNSDSQGRVATEFVVGGKNCITGRDIYDGKIIKTFPDGCQAYHLGATGSSFMNIHSVGIEICNIGWLKNGKTYVNTTCQPDQICTLAKPFRGYTQYQKYTDKQLESIRQLLLFIANRDNIDLHDGLYKWIKQKGADAFEFNSDAYYGKVKSLITHTNVRKDKSDCYPMPELMDMILSL